MRRTNEERTELILRNPNLYKSFLTLALPVCGANILKALHDLIDTYFIGQMPNSVSAQAGISIVWPLMNILMAFNAGLTVAGVAVISQLVGSNDHEQAKKYSGLLLVLSVLFGLIIMVLLLFLTRPVMILMGAESDVLDCAVIYAQTRAFEMPFVYIFAAYQAIRQAQGDMSTPVVLSTVSVVVNIVLTALFVRVFNLGLFGAAFATVIGNVVIAPACLFYLFKRGGELNLKLSEIKIEKKPMRNMIGIALPSAGSQALSSLGFLVLQAFILSYGKEVSAAFSIGNKISNLLLIPVMAFGSVAAAFIGQNVGAHNKARAVASYKVSRNVCFTMSIIGSLILFPFCRFVIALLTNDPTTQAISGEYIVYVLLLQPLMAWFQNYMSVFNGTGNTRFSFIMASARLWAIRLPLIWIFKTFTQIGRHGIWYAMVISNFLILLLGEALFRKIDFEPKIKAPSSPSEKTPPMATDK